MTTYTILFRGNAKARSNPKLAPDAVIKEWGPYGEYPLDDNAEVDRHLRIMKASYPMYEWTVL